MIEMGQGAVSVVVCGAKPGTHHMFLTAAQNSCDDAVGSSLAHTVHAQPKPRCAIPPFPPPVGRHAVPLGVVVGATNWVAVVST